MEPGIYTGITNDAYHSGVGVSKSMLDILHKQSPLHLKAHRSATNDNRPPPTAAMVIGAALHSLVLEPHVFQEEYIRPFVAPEDVLVTVDDIKEALRDCGEKITGTKAELTDRLRAVRPDALFLDELKQNYALVNAGRTILPVETCEQICAMRDSIMGHPAASALLRAPGRAECSAYWVDPITGTLCRARPDYLRYDGVIVDLKTTDDASPEGFARSIATYRYHVQAACYLDGVRCAAEQSSEPMTVRAFVFIAVEKRPPYAVAVYALDAASLEVGHAEFNADLAHYARCEASGIWPGYGVDVQHISLPAWSLARAAEQVAA